MATRGRRSSFSSSQSSSASSSSSLAKRHSVSENPGKAMTAKPQLAKKRPALANLTNQRNGPPNASKTVSKKPMVPCEFNITKMTKESSTFSYSKIISENSLPTSWNVKSRTDFYFKDTCLQRADQPAVSITSLTAPICMDDSPSISDGGSVSLDETMSTCDS